MLPRKSLILALLCQFLSVDAGFSYDWSNWIILPADRESKVTVGGRYSGLSGLRNNRSELGWNYLDHKRLDPYVMSVRGAVQRKNNRQKKIERRSNDQTNSDLMVSLGRAVETVKNICDVFKWFFNEDNGVANEGRATSTTGSTRKIKKVKKKYKKFLLPLLIAYKLKFLTLIPVLIGGLILLVGTTGLAGFFFALFTAVMSLKSENKFDVKSW